MDPENEEGAGCSMRRWSCPFCTAGGANTLPQTPAANSTEEESPHSWENKIALGVFQLCTLTPLYLIVLIPAKVQKVFILLLLAEQHAFNTRYAALNSISTLAS